MTRPVARPSRACAISPAWGLCVLLLTTSLGLFAQARLHSEARIKAAYVIKFCHYVTWPEGSEQTGGPIRIGVMQQSKLLADLREEAREGRGRPIEVLALQSCEEALACHVFFLGTGETPDIALCAQHLRGRPILTVSDIPLALEHGLTIRLVEESKSLRFEVNQSAAEASGLKLDPQMLRYARSIQRSNDEVIR